MPRASRRRKVGLVSKRPQRHEELKEMAAGETTGTRYKTVSLKSSRRSSRKSENSRIAGHNDSVEVGEETEQHEIKLVVADSTAPSVADINQGTDEESLIHLSEMDDRDLLDNSRITLDEIADESGMFLPRSTSTPKTAVQQHNWHHPKVETMAEESSSPLLSSSSDPFGFNKIAGIRVIHAEEQDKYSDDVSDDSDQNIDRAQEIGSLEAHSLASVSSSPLSVLSHSPSLPSSPSLPPIQQQLPTNKAKIVKDLNTAQLTELLPRRGRKKRVKTVYSDEDFGALRSDDDYNLEETQARKFARRAKRSIQNDKENVNPGLNNAMLSTKVNKDIGKLRNKRQASNPLSDKRVDENSSKSIRRSQSAVRQVHNSGKQRNNIPLIDGSHEDRQLVDINSEDENLNDKELEQSQILENQMLKEKFREIDKWALEIEEVPGSSE
ncbi:hypothetical protein V1511DRAFT_497671 [Dipodascopsis uninucleata]